jgi:hypothetical protein
MRIPLYFLSNHSVIIIEVFNLVDIILLFLYYIDYLKLI